MTTTTTTPSEPTGMQLISKMWIGWKDLIQEDWTAPTIQWLRFTCEGELEGFKIYYLPSPLQRFKFATFGERYINGEYMGDYVHYENRCVEGEYDVYA